MESDSPKPAECPATEATAAAGDSKDQAPPVKTAAQLKKEAKKQAKLDKFNQKQEKKSQQNEVSDLSSFLII